MFLYRHNTLLLAALCVESLLAFRWWRQRYDSACFLVIAIAGSLAEMGFVRAGVWRYANPTAVGIPVWFPVSFGLAGLIGQRLVRCVVALWDQASPPQTRPRALE